MGVKFQKGQKGIIALAAAVAIISVPLYAVKIARRTDYSDFEVYYRTAQRAQAQNWKDIYNPAIDGNCPYRYAPTTLLLFEPFTSIPLQTAKVIWFLLQAGFYAVGFYGLFRVVSSYRSPSDAIWMLALTYLFVVRFCLDSFTIGQISGLMFACFAWSVFYFQRRETTSRSSLLLLLPTFLKVAPGFLFGVSFSSDRQSFQKFLFSALAGVLGVFALSVIWLRDLSVATGLWKNWFKIVISDSTYFDNSHYGSQSINSALLRFAHWSGFLTAPVVSHLWMAIVGCGSIAVAAFWFLRRPKGARGVLLFYGLGILAYLLFMPATFKYSQPFLAIPMLGLLSGHLNGFVRFVIAFAFLTLSLAGLDVIGPTLFFAFQKASVPVLTTLLIAVAVVRESLLESTPRLQS